jgi:hypothetical protein
MGFIDIAGTTLAVVVSGFERYYKRWDKNGIDRNPSRGPSLFEMASPIDCRLDKNL